MAITESCFWGTGFFALDASAPKFFGFSEFLAGLALMVLAWTNAETRYRFRVNAAPIAMQWLTFGVVAFVGSLTLATDLWRAQKWCVPRWEGSPLTPASWQAVLAGLFFATFLTWAWFAFISPPVFGRRNAKRFAGILSHYILRGTPSDLAMTADEVSRSVRALVKHANDRRASRHLLPGEQKSVQTKTSKWADYVLYLIGDKRFCRSVVESSSSTAFWLFEAVSKEEKYGIPIDVFSRNVIAEAFANKNSFLYHEESGYKSGLFGHAKPLTTAIFGKYQLVEHVGTLLDLRRYPTFSDAQQWQAYCRVVLMTFRDYAKTAPWSHSGAIFTALRAMSDATLSLKGLNGVTDVPGNDALARLHVVVDFTKEAVGILDEFAPPNPRCFGILRVRDRRRETVYDHLARMIVGLISNASTVTTPPELSRTVQRSQLWYALFNHNNLYGAAGKAVKFKVRRLIYDTIVEMEQRPDFPGAKILRFCLNVLGIRVQETVHDKDGNALHRAILSWVRKNYASLHIRDTLLAEQCLPSWITYDAKNRRLVGITTKRESRRKPHVIFLCLDTEE